VDEGRAGAVGRALLEVDHERVRGVLGERKDLRAVEREDVLGDLRRRRAREVRVVDAEPVVEPGDLAGDEINRDEALRRGV
jgi:hypothetical protein